MWRWWGAVRTNGGGQDKIATLSEVNERECNRKTNNWLNMKTRKPLSG